MDKNAKGLATKPTIPKSKRATDEFGSVKKGKDVDSSDKGHSSKKMKQAGKVTKGKVVLDRAIKAKRDAIKMSTVTSVCQKGGILRSVQLSKHPILLNDSKMECTQQTESVFCERFICPYCTFTSEAAEPVRKHIDESHKRKDPTIIDRLCYVRKQWCKTFYCWNPECTFQTAVCEERESHTETSKCGDVYEQKYSEPVPKVKEKGTLVSKKAIKKMNMEEIAMSSNNESNGLVATSKSEKMKVCILQLFNECKSESLEHAEILTLDDCSKDELSRLLRDMAEESEVVCLGSLVFIV